MIEAITDYDKVTIKMVGADPVVIQRPQSITIREWQLFWGLPDYPPSCGGYKSRFTQADADANNRRRLEQLENV